MRRVEGGPTIHPLILDVLDRFLVHYRLSAPAGISMGPGESARALHPDDAIYPFPRPHPEVVVNVMWSSAGLSAANGATRIVPESHHWTTEIPGPDTESVTIEPP
jgi:ectoine hydroxylase-related dioxygenase (phytanoyl-CoA dioxygenase family)